MKDGLKDWKKHEACTQVCTCSCLCSNIHRILTVDVFRLGLKLHCKHYISINFHCLQARRLWRWWPFGNCVLPLSDRREFFQMEKGNGEDAKESGRTSKSLYSQKCSLHDRGVTSSLLHSTDHVYKYGGQGRRLSQAQPSLLPPTATFPAWRE